MSIKISELFLALTVSCRLVGMTFGLTPFLQTKKSAEVNWEHQTKPPSDISRDLSQGDAKRGYTLFDHNCAPCHGDDARGDEGPTLYDLAKSDARIGAIIKSGIKGEMPSFAKKFSDGDVQALIAYLRTLKD